MKLQLDAMLKVYDLRGSFILGTAVAWLGRRKPELKLKVETDWWRAEELASHLHRALGP